MKEFGTLNIICLLVLSYFCLKNIYGILGTIAF